MIKTIILAIGCIGYCGFILPEQEKPYLTYERYTDALESKLAKLYIEKEMLIEGCRLSLEKCILLASPYIFQKIVEWISKVKDIGIEQPFAYAMGGYYFLITFTGLSRIIRLSYVFSDIRAIKQELDVLQSQLDRTLYIRVYREAPFDNGTDHLHKIKSDKNSLFA